MYPSSTLNQDCGVHRDREQEKEMFPSGNSIAGKVKFQEDTGGDASHDVDVPLVTNFLSCVCLRMF